MSRRVPSCPAVSRRRPLSLRPSVPSSVRPVVPSVRPVVRQSSSVLCPSVHVRPSSSSSVLCPSVRPVVRPVVCLIYEALVQVLAVGINPSDVSVFVNAPLLKTYNNTHISYSLTKHGLKGSYSATKADATSLALSGFPGRVPPGSPRFTISQSSPTCVFLNFLSIPIIFLTFLLNPLLEVPLNFDFENTSLYDFNYPYIFDSNDSFTFRLFNFPNFSVFNIPFNIDFKLSLHIRFPISKRPIIFNKITLSISIRVLSF